MEYQKEYATLVGQVDRAISILEQHPSDDQGIRRARAILLDAIQSAEEKYIAAGELM